MGRSGWPPTENSKRPQNRPLTNTSLYEPGTSAASPVIAPLMRPPSARSISATWILSGGAPRANSANAREMWKERKPRSGWRTTAKAAGGKPAQSKAQIALRLPQPGTAAPAPKTGASPQAGGYIWRPPRPYKPRRPDRRRTNYCDLRHVDVLAGFDALVISSATASPRASRPGWAKAC